MQLLTVTNTPVEIGVSPFFTGSEALLYGAASLQLQGALDAAGTGGWQNIGTATVANQMQKVSLDYAFIRVSTAATLQLIGN